MLEDVRRQDDVECFVDKMFRRVEVVEIGAYEAVAIRAGQGCCFCVVLDAYDVAPPCLKRGRRAARSRPEL